MSQASHSRVALACSRYLAALDEGISAIQDAKAAIERVAALPFGEADDVQCARIINAMAEQLQPIVESVFGPVRKSAAAFEEKVKKISAESVKPDHRA